VAYIRGRLRNAGQRWRQDQSANHQAP
jgi:hypothetical protein